MWLVSAVILQCCLDPLLSPSTANGLRDNMLAHVICDECPPKTQLLEQEMSLTMVSLIK